MFFFISVENFYQRRKKHCIEYVKYAFSKLYPHELLYCAFLSAEFCKNCVSYQKRATIWCSNCDTFLCSDCSTSIHQLRALANHSTVPADQKPKQCQRHKESLKYWCLQDNVLLCQTCFNMDHLSHRIRLANEMAVEEIQKVCFDT